MSIATAVYFGLAAYSRSIRSIDAGLSVSISRTSEIEATFLKIVRPRQPSPLSQDRGRAPSIIFPCSHTTTDIPLGVRNAMVYQDILYEVAGDIATITINRPEKLNAVRNQTHDELVDALDRSDGDDSVRALIITGSGRAFCAGTDLSGAKFADRTGDPATGDGVPTDYAARVPLRIYDMNKPVIGALNGVAVGFGASVLCAMDIRLAAERGRVGFVYAKRGICNESCSSWFLPRLVGISLAVEWVATGRMISATSLKSAGFVKAVVPDQELLVSARELAREIADNTSPASVAVSRRLMWNVLGASHPREATKFESRGLTGLMALPDAKEGAVSFLEKRPPRFITRPSRDVAFVDRWWLKS